VVQLDSSTCGATNAVLIDVTAAEVLVRCDRRTPMTRVLLTIVPGTTDPADYPNALSLRFCGDVITAEGWVGHQGGGFSPHDCPYPFRSCLSVSIEAFARSVRTSTDSSEAGRLRSQFG
jgi:hypothetical protein